MHEYLHLISITNQTHMVATELAVRSRMDFALRRDRRFFRQGLLDGSERGGIAHGGIAFRS